MLGVPPKNRSGSKLSDEFVSSRNAPSAITPEQYRRCADAAVAYDPVFRSVVERIKLYPEGNVVGANWNCVRRRVIA